MATRKITLTLAGQDNLVIERIRTVLPTPGGFTSISRRSINQVAIATAGSTQTLNLTIDCVLTQAEFALFEEYLFEQDRNGQRGNIVARNEYTPVNTRWSTINSRSQVGSAQTTHGSITQYFVQHPCLIVVSSDFWQIAGENNQGQWRDVTFEIEEVI